MDRPPRVSAITAIRRSMLSPIRARPSIAILGRQKGNLNQNPGVRVPAAGVQNRSQSVFPCVLMIFAPPTMWMTAGARIRRRRLRLGPGMVFGGGGLGLVAVLVISLLFGVDPSQLLNGGTVSPPVARQEAVRAPTTPTIMFARRIIGSAEDVWAPLLRQKGASFRPATLTVYDYATPTGCGTGQSSAGPFYCPATSTSIWTWPSSTS